MIVKQMWPLARMQSVVAITTKQLALVARLQFVGQWLLKWVVLPAAVVDETEIEIALLARLKFL